MRMILLAFLFSFSITQAQNFHTPAEILVILGDSKIKYNLELLTEEIPCPNYSERLINNEMYRVTNEYGQLEAKRYGELSEQGKYHYNKAEEHFKAGNADSSRFHYTKILDYDPQYYKVMTYIGQLYGIEENYDEAKQWYLRAIDSNYIDYMAHWFLAEIYLREDKPEEASNEITVASILNRNNPRIKELQFTAYGIGEYTPFDWYFCPQYQFEDVGENEVNLKYEEKWLSYALCKALWTYEPGYHELMGVPEGQYTAKEEFECISAMLTGLENADENYKEIKEFQIIYKAFDSNTINEFIFYEIILPKFPHVVYQFSREKIEAIRDYVLNIRQKM